MEEQLWIHRDSLAEAANSEHTDIKDIGLMHVHQPCFQSVKEVSPSYELFGIMGKKRTGGEKNGTVATG